MTPPHSGPATTSPALTDPSLATVRPARPVRRSREGAVCDLATRHLQGVSSLLAAREDLRGVHAFADVVEESVRWSA
ncbi:hypothetical protein [Nocardioides marmoraquaticus]